MSDTHFKGGNPASQSLTDKLQQAGQGAKQQASDALGATSDAAREKLEQVGAAAKETAGDAVDEVKRQLDKQQHVGADYANRLADNMRSAAKAFQQDTPMAARTIAIAAGYVDGAADKMRDGSMNDVVDSVTSFARRQPAAFLGLSVLAGFAAVRFLKASGGGSQASDATSGDASEQDDARRS
ncbi:hypothetical protein [Bradyrhizobium sp. LHD-71]|uniref:hypothetical protein n=1 Tax=Bradyrhizobium sp. LHD-71 TaxID=3072141 RepID=UPI00280ED489|nr:hypothetical protein [Bradyrhizobium sp. LHD-71]MDQ8729378.1 hypothetical protein [Bradyrhizobium sp. LHD-71]